MMRVLILLTDQDEVSGLCQVLLRFNPSLDIRVVRDLSALMALPSDILPEARLIGFSTTVIVPGSILSALGYGAYNFHPGPPNYPGLMPAQMAVLEGAILYGVTAHVMIDRVDAGPIVGLDLFSVPQGSTAMELLGQAFQQMGIVFARLARPLAADPAPLPVLSVIWSKAKSTRQSMRRLSQVSPDLDAEGLDRVMRAFGGGQFGIYPTVLLQGRRFRLVPDAAEATPAG